MRLSVQNLGMIKQGDIKIDGMTVIAGKNGVGKSTLGKMLYCLCRSFYHAEEKVEEEIVMQINLTLSQSMRREFNMPRRNYNTMREYAEWILHSYRETNEVRLPDELNAILEGNSRGTVTMMEHLRKSMEVTPEEILHRFFYQCSEVEFGGQLNPINHPLKKMEVRLEMDDGTEFCVEKRGRAKARIISGESVSEDAIFIDDPFLLDMLSENMSYISFYDRFYHRRDLIERMVLNNDQESVINSILGEKAWNELEELIKGICDGTLTRDQQRDFGYVSDRYKEPVSLEALSTGMKSILILKTLIENGSLTDETILIFDEPEVHLHPEWQFQLARILVLLPKVLGVKVLVSTHSTDFISAIDYYSKEDGIQDLCKFYQIVKKEDYSIVNDVTDQIDVIYNELSTPFLQVADKI